MPLSIPVDSIKLKNFAEIPAFIASGNIGSLVSLNGRMLIGTSSGTVFRLNPNGSREQVTNPNPSSGYVRHMIKSNNIIYAIGGTTANLYVSTTTDYGDTWNTATIPSPGSTILAGTIFKRGDDIIVLAGSYVVISTDGGANYTVVSYNGTIQTRDSVYYYGPTNEYFLGYSNGYTTINADSDLTNVANYIYHSLLPFTCRCFNEFNGKFFATGSDTGLEVLREYNTSTNTFDVSANQPFYSNTNSVPSVLEIYGENLYKFGSSESAEYTTDGKVWTPVPRGYTSAGITFSSSEMFNDNIYVGTESNSIFMSLQG